MTSGLEIEPIGKCSRCWAIPFLQIEYLCGIHLFKKNYWNIVYLIISLSLSRWDIWMTMPPSSNWKSSTTQTYCMCLEVGKRMMLFFTSKIKMRLNTPARILLSGNLRRTCVFKDDRYELLKKISQCMVTAFCSALPLHVWVSPYSPFLGHSLCYWWLLMEKVIETLFW